MHYHGRARQLLGQLEPFFKNLAWIDALSSENLSLKLESCRLGPKPARFQLERKVLTRQGVDPGKVFEKRLELPEQLPSSPVVVQWAPVDDSLASIECIDGTAWQGRVPGLQSGFNHVRISSTSPDGKRIDYADFVIEVGRPPRPPWMNWALAGLMLIAFYQLRLRIAKMLGLVADSKP